MEDDLTFSNKWKTISTFLKMKDNHIYFQMEDNLNLFKWKTILYFFPSNGRQYIFANIRSPIFVEMKDNGFVQETYEW
jgi:predicted ABC-type exoprotein transport system permease subunit